MLFLCPVENSTEQIGDIYALSLCIGSFYAITDEIHQIFVPNRGPAISDVLIDTSGVFFGILIAIIIIRIIENIGVHRPENDL